MKTSTSIKTNWNGQEFKAYLLIYAMNADLTQREEEIELIKNQVFEDIFLKMQEEFNNDNDYEAITKIISTINDFNYSEEEIQSLTNQMKEVFKTDNDFSIMERNLALGLKRLLKQ
ncbi:hypothetical protein EV195_104217 [Tenacibaculum skagerrakense]|uniref:Tellurite resistance protein TerB n=1 Tax=Tenacibaculum skagerrakense TaxID=186571 RepID=A0A4R2NUK0_9FLAO|nr:hypothetical protein [Tenacibaculum skagerrakense]TCP25184.1 hypothetical protein EV195_104217 [Tenacibaculum skagerrakense]